MNYTGFLNVYKEKGMTSMSVCARIRRILNVDKAGHAGTLDPMAEGVLPVALGRACKSVEEAAEGVKIYRAGMLLGRVTDTQDITGKTISEWNGEFPDRQKIEDAVRSFEGGYEQLTPMYSARQVGGQRLYDIARSGREVERKRKHIEIRSIEVNAVEGRHVSFTVECSGGTYVRTICHDIGEKLGCGACMDSLVRTKVGRFEIENALTFHDIENLQKNKTVDSALRVITPTAVSIGKFDGTHVGHQALLRELRKTSEKFHLRSLVLLVTSGDQRIEDREEQRTRLLSMGIDYVIELPLTQDIMDMSAERFIREILIGKLSMKYLVGGTDISFGRGKEGNAEFLKEKASEFGFHFRLIDKINVPVGEKSGETVEASSTLLHTYISKGNMEAVKSLMGKYPDFSSTVTRGRHIGTDILNVPTINQIISADRILPPYGVYLTRVTVLGKEDRKVKHDLTAPKGRNFESFYGISNLGIKPSVNEGKDPVMLETHLLTQTDTELYGREVNTELLHFIRPEQKFESLELLKEQIQKNDIPEALAILKTMDDDSKKI